MAASKAVSGAQSQIMQGSSALEHHQHQVQKQNFFSRPMSGNSNNGSNGSNQQKQGKSTTGNGGVQGKQNSSTSLSTNGTKGAQSVNGTKVYLQPGS
jgi:hypothetical protein